MAIKNHQYRKYVIKDIKKTLYFLRIRTANISKGLFLSQRKFASDLPSTANILKNVDLTQYG